MANDSSDQTAVSKVPWPAKMDTVDDIANDLDATLDEGTFALVQHMFSALFLAALDRTFVATGRTTALREAGTVVLAIEIGLAQAVFSKGESPRAVSIFAGSVYGMMVGVILAVAEGVPLHDDSAIVSCICFSLLGGFSGYLAGVFAAGIFLVSDRVRRWIRAR